MENYRLIMLPEDPGFQEILSLPPPSWEQQASGDGDSFIASYEQGGVLQLVDWKTAQDYAWGGEMDLVETTLNAE